MPLPPAPLRRRSLPATIPDSPAGMLQAAAIVVAILYFAREMLIPIVLAVLLSFVLAPPVRALGRVRVPRVAAVLLVVALGFGAILGLGLVMGRQATSLAANLPAYKATVAEKLHGLRDAGGRAPRPADRRPARARLGGDPAGGACGRAARRRVEGRGAQGEQGGAGAGRGWRPRAAGAGGDPGA